MPDAAEIAAALRRVEAFLGSRGSHGADRVAGSEYDRIDPSPGFDRRSRTAKERAHFLRQGGHRAIGAAVPADRGRHTHAVVTAAFRP
jgi:hypothetical protein